jgi:hypothetical protein
MLPKVYILDIQSLLFFHVYLLLSCLASFFFPSVAALATANARIASLEAELLASQQAYDAAAATKANAEKLQKATLGKSKKALADVKKEYAQREQAVAECPRTMSTAAESECFALSSFFDFCCLCCTY